MAGPLGYLLTWTTYGTWLPGDDRGSISHASNRPGDGRAPSDPRLRDAVLRDMRDVPLILSPPMRDVVTTTIRAHSEVRAWPLLAVNVRSNHAHAVVSAHAKPVVVLTQFKSWCTRRLREAGLVEPGRTVWTRHGSTRYLWDDRALHDACAYVRDWQEGKRFERGERAE